MRPRDRIKQSNERKRKSWRTLRRKELARKNWLLNESLRDEAAAAQDLAVVAAEDKTNEV